MTYDTNYADSPLNHATLHAAMTVPRTAKTSAGSSSTAP